MFMRLILEFLKPYPQLWGHLHKIGFIFSQFMVDDVTSWFKTSTFWENGFTNKLLIHLKVPFTFYFHLFINAGRYMKYQFRPFLPIFGLATSPRGARTLKFWDNGFKNEYLTSNFPLLLTFILLSPLVHEIQVWALFDSVFGLMTSPWKSKLQYFEKVISETCSLLRSSMKYWFRSLDRPQCMIYNFATVLSDLDIMTPQKK